MTSTPHGVYAVLHHGLQGFCEPLLGHIMLVLAYANGLGFNLHQLRQGVLKPPGNGHSGAKVDVVFREFLRCQGEAEYTEAPASFTIM